MNNYFLEYYDKIRNGEIIVGKELRTMLDRLYVDLSNPRYYFDLKPGSIRIDFIETFCKHTKSPFTGLPFKLTLWEKAFLQVSYGFKMSDTKLRRFNEVILLIARKNGKTTFIAGIDLAEFFLSKGVDIVCASNTSEQANILFDEINNMREASKVLEKRTSKNIFCIKFGKKNDKRSSLNKSKIKKMSAQSKNKDGYNIEVGCIDEVHEMTDSKVYDAIKQSQSTKKEPLIFIITTEGVTVGGFLDSKLEYARKIIKGEIEELKSNVATKRIEIETAKASIDKYKAQQDNVRNNREYDVLTKEIEFQTLEVELCEKRIREYTSSIESKQEEIEKNTHTLEERKKDLEMKKNELDEIISETKQEEEKLRDKAKSLEATIEPRLLQAFKRIRKNSRNGLGITYVQRDACGGCFNKIPPQKQLDIRMRKKIIVCEYCGRIMIDPELAGVMPERHLETKVK